MASTQRKRADEYLLSALAPGLIPETKILRLMESLVMPGQATRFATRMRKTDDAGRHKDPVAVGQRRYAYNAMYNALKSGAWVQVEVDGVKMLRHRDWVDRSLSSQPPPELVPLPVPAPVVAVAPNPPVKEGHGYQVPTEDEFRVLKRIVKGSDWERAAIVATYVGSGLMSPAEFAVLNIRRLATVDAVQRYLDAWTEQGLPIPAPGDTVTLPRVGFLAATSSGRQIPSLSLKPGKAWNLLVEVLGEDGAEDWVKGVYAQHLHSVLDKGGATPQEPATKPSRKASSRPPKPSDLKPKPANVDRRRNRTRAGRPA